MVGKIRVPKRKYLLLFITVLAIASGLYFLADRYLIEHVEAKAINAIFAINGDYYGFRSDGVLIRNGILFRDQPTRNAAALFENGTMQTFDETEVSSSSLLEDGVTHTLSFGSILIKNG